MLSFSFSNDTVMVNEHEMNPFAMIDVGRVSERSIAKAVATPSKAEIEERVCIVEMVQFFRMATGISHIGESKVSTFVTSLFSPSGVVGS